MNNNLKTNIIYNEDCLIGMKKIPDNSIDLILCDPPYGTIKGIGIYEKEHTDWDNELDIYKLFEEYKRVLRYRGRLILFSQEPFTSKLRTFKAGCEIKFNYPLIWQKNHFANWLGANKAPVKYFEDINVFIKEYSKNNFKEARQYFREIKSVFGLTTTKVARAINSFKTQGCLSTESTSFRLCSKETYQEIIDKFHINQYKNFVNYEKLINLSKEKEKVFNLPDGKKHVGDILSYKKDNDHYHPTQKPVKLLEFLINVYSNKGDIVLDNCIGSGSTAIACINTNRKYIGYENNTKFYEVCLNRIQNHISSFKEEQEDEKI